MHWLHAGTILANPKAQALAGNSLQEKCTFRRFKITLIETHIRKREREIIFLYNALQWGVHMQSKLGTSGNIGTWFPPFFGDDSEERQTSGRFIGRTLKRKQQTWKIRNKEN